MIGANITAHWVTPLHDISIPHGHQSKTQLFYFWSRFQLTYWGKQQKTTGVLGPLIHTWETQMEPEFLGQNSKLLGCAICGVKQQMEDNFIHSCCLSLPLWIWNSSFQISKSFKKESIFLFLSLHAYVKIVLHNGFIFLLVSLWSQCSKGIPTPSVTNNLFSHFLIEHFCWFRSCETLVIFLLPWSATFSMLFVILLLSTSIFSIGKILPSSPHFYNTWQWQQIVGTVVSWWRTVISIWWIEVRPQQ